MEPVDLRSDTVTRPTAAMLDAMQAAEVGDDVFADDPTVNRLQEVAAERLGKEAALLVPTGTMANLVCLRSQTEAGDEIILESGAHIFTYEGGGYAAFCGVSANRVPGVRGLLNAEGVRGAIRPGGGGSHFPPTRLVCLENTANRGGGSVYPLSTIAEIADVAREHDLRLHLDGARVFNAAVKSGIDVREIAAPFDSISFCLSKGLGCPVGSLVVGSRELIQRAHRFRKQLGGGMRQAGYLAAAGLHALEHHVERLADDHARARRLGDSLAALPGLEVDVDAVETNMVYVDVSGTGHDSATYVARLREAGALAVAVSPTHLRAVTHLDVDDDALERSIDAFRRAG